MAQVLELYLPATPAAERQRLLALADGSPGRALMVAGQGRLAVAGLVEEVIAAMPGFSLLRGHAIADAMREETAFDLFFTLLRAPSLAPWRRICAAPLMPCRRA